MKETLVPASEFKAKCLGLLDDIAAQGKSLTITKYGRPIARVVPMVLPVNRLRGSWKSTVRVPGGLAHVPVAEDWEGSR